MKRNVLIREAYQKLKKVFEKILNKKKKPMPSLILQPVRQNNLRGTDPF